MSELLLITVLLFLAYLLSSIPTYFTGRLSLLSDFVKGSLAVFICSSAGVDLWLDMLKQPAYDAPKIWPWLGALAALIGHSYSPWLRFRSREAMAFALGEFMVLSVWSPLGGILFAVVSYLAFRSTPAAMALSKIATLVGILFTHLILNPVEAYSWPGAVILFILFYQHESELDEILKERENAN